LKDWARVLENVAIPEIDLAMVERHLMRWKAKRDWKPATYNNALGQLSGFLSFCYKRDWISKHPLQRRAERMGNLGERERYFQPHELAAMEKTALAVARWKHHARPTWLHDIIIAAPYTGLRRGVFCKAGVQDVRHDENGELWLRVARDKNGRPIERRLMGELRTIVERRLSEAVGGGPAVPRTGRPWGL